jgi:hypothetical protein
MFFISHAVKKKESLYYLSSFSLPFGRPGRVGQHAYCFRTKTTETNRKTDVFFFVFFFTPCVFLFGFVPNLTCLKTAYFLRMA